MDHFRVPVSEIERRKNRIQHELQEIGIEALFIVQRVDLFYFTGTAQNGYLFMPARGNPLLFLKKYMPRAREESSIGDMVQIESVKEIPDLLSDFYGRFPRVLALEFDVLPVRDYQFYCSLFQSRDYVDGSPAIHKVRKIKSPWELRQMDRAAGLSRKTFEYIGANIRPGVGEMEFSGMCETFARRHGHGGQIRTRHYMTEGYPWHILSGKSGGMVGLLDSPASGEGTSVAFPCGAGNKLLASREPVMVDFGTVLNGYHMDETRMFAIDSMPEKAMRACHAAIEIHNTVLEEVKPGLSVGELFERALVKARTLGYAEQYLGPPGYKVNFVGHGIGLELIEPPIISRGREDLLEPGMVFALEPKIVFHNEFSAGIESVFQVTATGCRLISQVPVKVFIC